MGKTVDCFVWIIHCWVATQRGKQWRIIIQLFELLNRFGLFLLLVQYFRCFVFQFMDIVKEFPYYRMNMISVYEDKGLSEIRGFLDVK